eukprot:2742438-Pleurochrysis_carterae.AAC.1
MTATRSSTTHLILARSLSPLMLAVCITILICYSLAVNHVSRHIVQGVAGMALISYSTLGVSCQNFTEQPLELRK